MQMPSDEVDRIILYHVRVPDHHKNAQICKFYFCLVDCSGALGSMLVTLVDLFLKCAASCLVGAGVALCVPAMLDAPICIQSSFRHCCLEQECVQPACTSQHFH